MKAIWFLKVVLYLINTMFLKVSFPCTRGQEKARRASIYKVPIDPDKPNHKGIKTLTISSQNNRAVTKHQHCNWTHLIWFLALPLIIGLVSGKQSDLLHSKLDHCACVQVLCQSTCNCSQVYFSVPRFGVWPARHGSHTANPRSSSPPSHGGSWADEESTINPSSVVRGSHQGCHIKLGPWYTACRSIKRSETQPI